MKKNIYFYTNLLAWGLVFFLIGNYVFGWTTPSVPPPNDNLPAPINVSSDPQTKSGNLTIGGNLTTGGFKMAIGAGADKILTTDASGVASWQTPAGGEDTWITTQTCSTDYALQSVGKTTKTCINKVDYSDVAYDVSCTNCLTSTEVASADYATNAGTVDSINGASLLRSDVNDNLTAAIIVPTANRDEGIFGTYVSTKTQHIWSMGTGYRNAADGASFGNLYGLAYKYNGPAGGHGVYLVNNGSEKVGLGTNLWTSGAITGATINTGYGAKEIGDTVGNCTSTQVHKGDGGCETESSLSVSYATTAGTASQITCTGCVAETEIAQNSLDDSEIQDNSLTAGSLAANSVGNSELIASPTFTDVNAPYFDVAAGNDYGLRFWNSSTYMISMGNDQQDYGWVTDYSIHSTMGTSDNRGFTWGYSNTNVVASLEAETGHFKTRGVVYAENYIRADGGFRQDGNVILNGTDTWLRTTGATGWYSATYGGGWYMTDTTYIRNYGTKQVLLSNNLHMNNHKITNLATPTVATDAATMGYVDSAGGTLSCHTVSQSSRISGYEWKTVYCDYGTMTGGGCYANTVHASAPTGNGWTCRFNDTSSATTCVRCCEI